ncbi:MAG: hypothetical protein AAGF11_39490 [Myxococcota bacterium]
MVSGLIALVAVLVLPEASAMLPATAVPTATAATDDGDATTSPFTTGNFRFAGGQRQRDAVHEAIERVVEALPSIFHQAARRRLGAANAIPQRVTMTMIGDDLIVRYGDLQPQRAPLDGSVREWRNREGTRVSLKHELRGDKLVQTTWSSKGRRTMVWSLSDDGQRLRVHSVMSAKLLPKDIDYRLTFRRR